MFRTLWCAAVTSTMLAGLALAADAPSGGKSGQKPAVTGELAKAIDVIKNSQVASEVTEAYRGARDKYAASPELHRAYMVRMLKYGMIPLALGAAEKLVAADPNDGLAWGVKAYVDGKGGRYPKAIESAVLAAKYEPDNAPVLTGLGQLSAWRENTPKAPAISESAKAVLDELGETLKGKEPFKAAHDAVAKAYAEAGDRRKALEAKLAGLRTQGTDADKEYRNLGQQLDANNRQISDLKNRNGQLRAEVSRLSNPTTPAAANPRGGAVTPPKQRPLTPAEAALRDRNNQTIRENENTIRELSTKNDALNRTRNELRVKARKLTTECNQVSEELKATTADINKAFRWDPPAVDGVVTLPKDYLPGDPKSASGSKEEAPAAVSASAPAVTSESGERDFKLAQLHVDSGNIDLARRKLDAIVAQFPDTPLAAKAQALLEKIKDRR